MGLVPWGFSKPKEFLSGERLGWAVSVPWFLPDFVGFVLPEGNCHPGDREGLAVAPGGQEEVWLLHVRGAQ